ncbi:conserved hypothetical protein [Verticillium alfalfae VaMs.102]|uniref:Heterokaryon incompatibility domain-containing protein n=1 Tax=Verticillium alfalfae (strain VaMs.102 / ATCC MYA-4576 / FGSC 10136) TaxID=526221 RepID=C9S564_VERA1|nr:conserved hypothetical protein [Verticillium alfalfae VaMs.102]EEY14164.1 conserved hypothetical protein [Verticillium alfalfae VaMs.102]
MSFSDDRLCPICANLNIEGLFDPTRFKGLPPAPSPESEAVRWDNYIQHAATWRRLTREEIVAHYPPGIVPSCPFCEIVGGIGHLLAAGRPLNPNSHTPRETKKVLLAIPSDLLYDIATSRREQYAMNATASVFLLIMDQVQYDEAKAKSFGSTSLFVRFAHRDFPGSLVSLVANQSLDLRRPLDLPMQGRRFLEEKIDYKFKSIIIQICRDGLPPVILDTMRAVVKLGFRYVWIDRYCIWQDDQIHKMSQVERMDQIYSDAELTIVAVGAKDPSYGIARFDTKPNSTHSYQ